jgi:restriction system protein
MKTEQGQLRASYSVRGIPSFSVEVWHEGLNKHRLIKGSAANVVLSKAAIQALDWEGRWEVVDSRNQQLELRQSKKEQLEDNKAEAALRTHEAVAVLTQLSEILNHTFSIDDAVEWEGLKNREPYPDAMPTLPKEIRRPQPSPSPRKPLATDAEFLPSLDFLCYLFWGRKRRAIAEAEGRLEKAQQRWSIDIQLHLESEAERYRAYEVESAMTSTVHVAAMASWTALRTSYVAQQNENNDAVEARRQAYLLGNHESIVDYCDMVLSASEYPEFFPQEFELDYNPGTKILIVNYKLPSPQDMPTVKAVKYIVSTDEFEEQHLTESQTNKQFDDVLYQICLRTLHELYEGDVINAIESVVFNGVVTSIDRSTGQMVTACILSVQANRKEFLEINLELVDPKQCFKSLKGVGSSKLHGLAAVPPVMSMSREDARFVGSYGVADSLDNGSNLASMSWEDFEHLIREMFEKEFMSNGGEVKVTQASRDGGVDAIAFDPDPIRGGKVVIQAKRYTNTVGVSAVRDLYGTVMNEGANKGILVTTSDYGPDSYAFAKGKPLQLLNGGNLLSLLQKHGYKAHINLGEAKKAGKSA